MECAVVFLFGAINYMAIEILWRGYTHWTMAIAGGFCAMFIYIINMKFKGLNLICKAFVGALLIIFLELIIGIIINIILGWNVWDYSQKTFNFMGQICLEYFILWFFLCIPVFKLFNYFQEKIVEQG